MKIFGLTLVMALAIGGAAMADTAALEVFPGWNQVSCPLAPLNLSVEADDGLDYTEPYWAFQAIGDALLNNKMSRYDAATGNSYTYGYGDPTFGKLLLGDGYSVFVDESYFSGSTIAVSYPGIKNGIRAADTDPMTDMWISLPGVQESPNVDAGGWNLIGTPYATPIPAYEIMPDDSIKWHIFFTDGNEMVDWMTAVDVKQWVQDNMTGIGPGGSFTMSYGLDNYTMQPGQAYWFKTAKDNIAMVIVP